MRCYSGHVENQRVTMILCGVGKVVAAMATQSLIQTHKATEIVNLGICGALNESLKIGDIVYGHRMVQHDFNLHAQDKHPAWIPMFGTHLIRPRPSKLCEQLATFENTQTGIMTSGDRFIQSKSDKIALQTMTQALTCDMESSAVAQVCAILETPFVNVRAVSDIAEEVPSDFSANMDLAIENVTEVFVSCLKSLEP